MAGLLTFYIMCLENSSGIIIRKGFYTAIIERGYVLAGVYYSGVILDDASRMDSS
jgi:hypothetical protein